MASMAMVQAVMEHASVQEELTRHEEETSAPFQPETAAIGHFAKIARPKPKRN
jgi:hypothetical protein